MTAYQPAALEIAPETKRYPTKMAALVAYRGRMTKNGYQPENHQWRDHLCDRDENCPSSEHLALMAA